MVSAGVCERNRSLTPNFKSIWSDLTHASELNEFPDE
jgi:hypothetical protein